MDRIRIPPFTASSAHRFCVKTYSTRKTAPAAGRTETLPASMEIGRDRLCFTTFVSDSQSKEGSFRLTQMPMAERGHKNTSGNAAVQIPSIHPPRAAASTERSTEGTATVRLTSIFPKNTSCGLTGSDCSSQSCFPSMETETVVVFPIAAKNTSRNGMLTRSILLISSSGSCIASAILSFPVAVSAATQASIST